MKKSKIHNIFDRNDNKLSSLNSAFHQAGHAAAIYLNNKAQNLPPVFFQISLKDVTHKHDGSTTFPRQIEGGRLIQSLPHSLNATGNCIVAFEADIENLLMGPLAEAKYVHECDNELFTEHLVNIDSLNNYGGREKVSLVYEYLRSLYPEKRQQDEKLRQLLRIAFDFVRCHANWQAITYLADYLYESNENKVRYEKIVSVLEAMQAKHLPISTIPATIGSNFSMII